VSVIDIDAQPATVARHIQRAEFVITSSLHGLIFSHALGRPAVLIAPLTAEPEFKYRDYFASVGMPWRCPPALDEVMRSWKPVTPHEVRYELDDFALPSLERLRSLGIAD
jgi:hypothetical protein